MAIRLARLSGPFPRGRRIGFEGEIRRVDRLRRAGGLRRARDDGAHERRMKKGPGEVARTFGST